MAPARIKIRRAEPTDALAIQALAAGQEGNIQRRFGPDALATVRQTIEMCPLAFVGVQQDPSPTAGRASAPAEGSVVGFLALSNGPPAEVHQTDSAYDFSVLEVAPSAAAAAGGRIPMACGNWPAWMEQCFECSKLPLTLANTKFVSLFVASAEQSQPFLEAACEASFTFVPALANLAYLMPEGVILFAPFNAPSSLGVPRGTGAAGDAAVKKVPITSTKKAPAYFAEVAARTDTLKFSLQVCSRSTILPTLQVRRARVEDCDDILPMLQQQNLLRIPNADYYLSSLLDEEEVTSSNSPTNDTTLPTNLPLVAEYDGRLVGFMNLSTTFDMQVVREVYETSIYDDFRGGPEAPQEGAFCISLFCVQDAHAKEAFRMVVEGFARFPKRPFCLITVPTGCADIPLLRSFAQVPVRLGRVASHGLYVANCYCLRRPLSVRPVREADLSELTCGLLEGKAYAPALLDQVRAALRDLVRPELRAMVAHEGDSLVGLVVLKRSANVATFADQFDLDDFLDPATHFLGDRSPKHPLLHYLCLNPLFETQTKWVLEEVLRLTGASALLYCCEEDAAAGGGGGSREQVASSRRITSKYLMPVRRRRQIQFPGNARDRVEVPAPLLGNLLLLSAPLLHEWRVNVDARIVVLGASDVGLAFLEQLIYNPRLHFANLVLIDADGMGAVVRTAPAFRVAGARLKADAFATTTSAFSNVELHQLGIEHHVQVLQDECNAVDRVTKTVHLVNGSVVAYDYLILSPGVQYQLSALGVKAEEIPRALAFNKAQYTRITALAAKLATSTRAAGKVVVYGRGVDAFHCVHGLLQKGLAPTALCLLLPALASARERALDAEVEVRLVGKLRALGAQVQVDWDVHSLREGSDGLVELELMHGKEKKLMHKVSMFVYADKRNANINTFHILNSSSLVYDGRLVVDKYFRTQDPCIFAGGPITKYASAYDTEWAHGHYSSREVGAKLAEVLMPLFDPTLSPFPVRNDKELLTFREPVTAYALLPGNQYYFHFSEPSLEPLSEGQFDKHTNTALVFGGRTGDGSQPVGESYVRLRIDQAGFIRALTYCSPKPVAAENLRCLYGLHESYLNRLLDSYGDGMIADFARFCEETWALPLFHDRFRELVQQQRRALLTTPSPGVRKILATLQARGSALESEEREQLLQAFHATPERTKLDRELFAFATMALYKEAEGVEEVLPSSSSVPPAATSS